MTTIVAGVEAVTAGSGNRETAALPADASAWRGRTLAIMGLGLIGGSIARRLHERQAVARIVAIDRDPATLRAAREAGVVSAGYTEPGAFLEQADALVVAVPVGAILAALQACAPHLSAGCLVSDTGSTKAPIVAGAPEALGGDGGRLSGGRVVRFLGGHPMAGSERAGWAASRSDLFEGAVYAFTPAGEDPAEWFAFARLLGARPVCLDAAEHDAVVALTSHLPYLASVALSETVAGAVGDHPHWRDLVGSGLRDSLRLAAGDPVMSGDMCRANAPEVQRGLAALRERLRALEDALEATPEAVLGANPEAVLGAKPEAGAAADGGLDTLLGRLVRAQTFSRSVRRGAP